MAARKLSENWDDYRYFLAVAQTGTLSAAAERLGTEHTTVSRRIRALETVLNSRLFHKSTTGYVLTPEGARVLEVVQGIERAFHASRAIAAHRFPDVRVRAAGSCAACAVRVRPADDAEAAELSGVCSPTVRREAVAARAAWPCSSWGCLFIHSRGFVARHCGVAGLEISRTFSSAHCFRYLVSI
ncbi:LysR family transcriptional regulator [Burkholderia lata]|uniref:LysR family transcriptional regulator n=1 Tax=Burkholderia lata (strain ATCC 17760 / DSM 23089 / LMG 22485 / NCIMB 9086 / R18194 / 383) TaxID=482957 RepID=UPI003F68B38B